MPEEKNIVVTRGIPMTPSVSGSGSGSYGSFNPAGGHEGDEHYAGDDSFAFFGEQENREKQIQDAYAARLLTLPQVVEADLAAVRPVDQAAPATTVEALTREVGVYNALIAGKTTEAANQQNIANSFYGVDPTTKTTDDWANAYNTVGPSGRIPDGLTLLTNWTAAYTAAYTAKFINDEVAMLNSQLVPIQQNLVAAQAQEAAVAAEAKRVADEAAAAEAARVAAEAEAKRIADEAAAAEAARIAAEAEAKRIADEAAAAEAARLAAEAEAKRIADEAAVAEAARIAAEAEAQRVARQQAARQAVFRSAGTLALPANAATITVSGQGLIQVGEGAAVLAKAVADGIAELGRLLLAGPGMYIATFVTLGLYSPSTASEAQDSTPDRIRYGLGLPADQLGLPPGTDLRSIALAQGTVELPWRLTNEAKGDRSLISVINADGVTVSKAVSVRAAALNATTGLYEVVIPTTIPDQPPITLTWTPADAPGSANPSSTTPAVPQEIPVYTGTTLEPITVTAETYPGVIITPDDLITWFPADSGIAPVYVMFSEPLDSGIFTRKQLDKKYSEHASDFGINDTRKNRETLAKFRDAIEAHLADKETLEKGVYRHAKGSKVFYNPKTNNVVILKSDGTFLSGWKLSPGTPQFNNYINKDIL